MATQSSKSDLVAALARVDGKAEIVGGEIVVRRTRSGRAYADNTGFLVDLPRRKSFSPDASYHVGPPPGPGFLQGAPIFAAEVRSEDDYGPLAERAMAAKRAEYFAAGSRVVWDVDVLREELVRVYRAEAPDVPAVYRRGERAEAAPALPGWMFSVDDLFE